MAKGTSAQKCCRCKNRGQGSACLKVGVQRGRLRGGPEVVQKGVGVCKTGCGYERGRGTNTKMVIGRRMGWASADEGGRWRSWGQGCLLPAPLPGSWPQNGSGLRRCAGREQAGGPGREQAARPPACTECVRGLGTRVPPTTAAHTRLPGQALGHSLPAFLLPPSSTVLQLRIHRRYQDTSKCGP